MPLDNPLDDTWKTYATVYLKSVSDEAKKDFARRSDAEKKVRAKARALLRNNA